MEDNCDIIEMFTAKLGENKVKNKSVIYHDQKCGQNSTHLLYKDVLSHVASSLKAIQNADSLKANSGPKHNLEKFNKSTFCSVSQLCVDEQHSSAPSNKFDTQYVTDTELIDIIEGAEAIMNTNVEKGSIEDINSSSCSKKPGQLDKIIVETKSNTSILSDTKSCDNHNVNIVIRQNADLKDISHPKNNEEAIQGRGKNDIFVEKNIINEAKLKVKDDNFTQILNESLEQDNDLCDLGFILEQDEFVSSPIIKVKGSKINKSPLVFDLQSFENFENKVLPVISLFKKDLEVVDIDCSPILEKQFNNIEEKAFDTFEDKVSPISNQYYKINAETSRSKTPEIFLECQETLSESIKIEYDKLSPNIFKDEILFSSDEEDLKFVNELPFTCALETSFYTHQSQVLDKTMFVAFQTASNKSIQINTDSFDKAKSIFDRTLKCDDVEESSLTELVQKYDQNINEIESRNTIKCEKAIKKDIIIKNIDNITSNFSKLNKKGEIVFNFRNNENISKIIIEDDNGKPSETAQAKIIKTVQDVDLSIVFDKDTKNDIESPFKLKFFNQASLKTDHLESKFGAESLDSHLNFDSFQAANKRKKKETVIDFYQTKSNFGDKFDVFDDNKENITVSKSFETTANHKVVHNERTPEIEDKQESHVLSPVLEKKPQRLNKTENLEFEPTFHSKIKSLAEIARSKIGSTEELGTDSIDIKLSIDNINNKRVCTITDQHCVRFKTGLGKDIKISESALKGAQKKVCEINDDIRNSEMMLEHTKHSFDTCKRQTESKNQILLKTSFGKSTNSESSNKKESEDIFKVPLAIKCKKRSKNCIEIPRNKDNLGNPCDKGKTFCAHATTVTSINKFKSNNNKANLNYNNSCTNNSFVGFQTASNKKIEISNEALVRTAHIFQGLDGNNDIVQLNDIQDHSYQEFKEFKTASNKDITVSNESLGKTAHIFQGLNGNNDIVQLINIHDHSYQEFKGFKTASNKDIAVSNESLVRTKQLFQDIDEYNDNIIYELNNKYNNSNGVCKGFQTASNKKVDVSNEAIQETSDIFKDIDNINNKSNDKSAHNMFQGFQTASNKNIKACKQALAKTKHIFQNIQEPTTDNINAEVKTNHLQEIIDGSSSVFKGFQTASNKMIKVSKEAWAKTKQLFQDVDGLNEDLYDDINYTRGYNNIAFSGFQTASNKSVEVSEGVMLKTKNIFQDIDLFEKNVNYSDSGNNYIGFQTANNKKIQVSKESLAKTKQIFFNIDEPKSNTNTFKNKCNDICNGFQTGNNKIITISEDVKIKARHLFQDFHKSNDNIDQIHFKGFQTASNKNIEISKDALSRTNHFYKDIELDWSTNILGENNVTKKNAEVYKAKCEEIELKNLFDTQIIDNFNNSLNTEDFCTETKTKKRCSSPILSCPNAKRKCFKTPYNIGNSQKADKNKTVPKNENKTNILDTNYKKTKIYKLKDLIQIENESKTKAVIDLYLFNFEFDNLLDFKFKEKRNNLVEEGFMSVNDVKAYFIKTVPNPKLIPENWLDIHLRLIIWKLLSYEIRFPKTMQFVCNSKTVIEQLTFRYRKELFNVERPILRKILEKDDLPSRTLILCVVKIYKVIIKDEDNSSASDSTELLLTDGWYTIRANIDRMLCRLIAADKIRVGCKLACSGAELMNCEQGVAPWEDTSSIRLKLSGNSTRPASWDARLGLHHAAAIRTELRAVHIDGGKVSRITAFVTRLYPTLYVEKFDDGSTVTRSERLEMQQQIRYETERDALMEKLYEQVEREIEQQESQESNSCSGKRKSLDSGSQIAKMMRKSTDPAHFRATLTSSQSRLLDDHSSKARENLLKTIEERLQDKLVKRNVVSLLKIRLASIDIKDEVVISKGVMSIWRPNDMLMELLQEGTWIEVTNVVPTAERFGEIQLTAGRQTTYSRPKKKINEKINLHAKSLLRVCYTIQHLVRNPTLKPDYNEIDTVGLIFSIEPTNEDFDGEKNKNNFQNVYLADEDKNFLCINFWGGIKKFGYENILDTGQVVAGINLQRRAGNTRKNIPQYRATEYSYFTKTPKNTAPKTALEDCVKKFTGIDRRKFCQDCLDLKTKHSVCRTESPYTLNNSTNNSKSRIYVSPFGAKMSANEDELNLSGLDFESTFRQKDTQDLSPKMLQRKKQINDKIARLKNYYGEPPPLSPMHILNKSKNATSSYKSPMLKCANNNISNNTSASSPILNTNCKRPSNLDSVKLNLIDKINSEDQFAEDFDASPPLSLE